MFREFLLLGMRLSMITFLASCAGLVVLFLGNPSNEQTDLATLALAQSMTGFIFCFALLQMIDEKKRP